MEPYCPLRHSAIFCTLTHTLTPIPQSPQSLTPIPPIPRKTDRHNSFDIPPPGLEDRSDGKRFVIGFTFNNDVTGPTAHPPAAEQAAA